MAVEYYTPNFASDADRIAPILASRDVAAGIYVWLHSRVFVSCNSIGISEARLAEIMGCERSSVQRAVKFLEGAGLVKHESYRGNGGGSRFHLIGLSDACVPHSETCKRSADAAFNGASMHLNAAFPQHQTQRTRSTIKTGSEEIGHQNKSTSPYDY